MQIIRMIANPERHEVHLIDYCYINLYNDFSIGIEECDA